MTDTATDPAALVADLTRRLGEAEETIRAIREGEVDALVIRGGGDEEVFTITGGDEGYRSFMEAMDVGAMALDDGARVLYANVNVCNLLGLPQAEMSGRTLEQVFGPRNGAAADGLRACIAGERRTVTIRIGEGDSGQHLIATATPMRIGTVAGHAVTLTDVTARVRSEAAEKSEEVAKAVIACANEAMFVCDRGGTITHASAAASVLAEGDLVGRPFSEVVQLVFTGMAGLMQADDIVTIALDGGSVRGVEALAPKAPGARDFLVSAAPLRLAGAEVTGCVITLTDISRRKAAEKQQQLLMAELDHRVKNILTLVLSIGRKMARTTETLEHFQAGFIGRIEALAATHTLLADRSWQDLSIGDIVRAELAPTSTPWPGR